MHLWNRSVTVGDVRRKGASMAADDDDEQPDPESFGKWVRVLADYSTEGIWYQDGCPASADALPVSDALRVRLLAWSLAYEDCEDYLPADRRTAPGFDIATHAAEGLEIAKAIKRELPDWTVIYFDHGAWRWKDRTQDRNEVEYEVTV
jgi:hypothetical protein